MHEIVSCLSAVLMTAWLPTGVPASIVTVFSGALVQAVNIKVTSNVTTSFFIERFPEYGLSRRKYSSGTHYGNCRCLDLQVSWADLGLSGTVVPVAAGEIQ